MRGAVIGTYRLVDKLGEGGMGAVWLAEHTLLGRRAAIKVLLPAFSTNASIVQRFFNEAKAVAAIADPGIVQIFDFGVHTDGAAYIVMEVLDGETLDARLRRLGRLSPLDAIRLVRQIALSLSAAHAKGVIHRDIKPENLFVVGDPAVTGGERTKVLDFGIAKLSGDDNQHKTRTGAMLGTPVYMSPEQCRGAGNIDHRTDLYSLGAVLFCLAAGRPPFEGEGSGDVIIAHVRDQPPVPSSLAPGIPAVLDDAILRCLEKDPARRYQTMDELAAALGVVEAAVRDGAAPARVSVGLPVVGYAAPMIAGPSQITTMSSAIGEAAPVKAPGRRRWTSLAISATVAAGVTVGGIVMLRGGGSGERASAARGGAAEPSAPPSVPAKSVVTVSPIEAAAPAAPGRAPAVPAPAPIDAGIAAVAPPVDATPRPAIDPTRPRGTRRPEGSTRHGNGTSEVGHVDRGD